MMNLRWIIFLLIVVSSFGCLSAKQPLTLVPLPQPGSEFMTEAVEADEPPISAETKFTYDNSPEIQAAVKEFATTGKAPIVKRAGFVQFPFGEVQPMLNCQQNYGCDIELEAGEQVKAVILGNEPLWDYLVWESNQQSQSVSHVTIGPRVSQARTNAIIGTDRRTYHLELISTTKSDYVRSAKFYYPRERLREFQSRKRKQELVEGRKASAGKREQILQDISQSGGLPYQYVSFGWEITGGKVSWKPLRAFDDGAHIYLQFPESVVFEDLPGVYAPTSDGQLAQPVWRTVKPDEKRSREKGTYIMIDGMFEELQLVGGFRGKQQTVVIKKKR